MLLKRDGGKIRVAENEIGIIGKPDFNIFILSL